MSISSDDSSLGASARGVRCEQSRADPPARIGVAKVRDEQPVDAVSPADRVQVGELEAVGERQHGIADNSRRSGNLSGLGGRRVCAKRLV